MTDLRFKVNGHDYSSMVTVREYKTNKIPVEGTSYVSLDKYNHTTIARYRGYLEVQINPQSPTELASFYDDLLNAPCEVQYWSFQSQSNVTETMMPSFSALQDAKDRGDGHWVREYTISFTQE